MDKSEILDEFQSFLEELKNNYPLARICNLSEL